jgi:hypothetical protein
LLEKQFNHDLLYNGIVHFYIDKKLYSKEKANFIAQTIVRKETQKRICKNKLCMHFTHSHIRNSEICLVVDCKCNQFAK